MYYNPKTNTRITHKELRIITNSSLPNDIEYYSGFYKIHEINKPSSTSEYHILTESPIEFIDGKYCVTYTLTYKPLEELKNIRYKHIEERFEKASATAFITSSYGFRVDANDVANRNVEGLIKVMKADNEETVLFKDYDNNFHNVSLEELEKIQLEIIKNGQNLYKQKWNFLNDISSMTEESKIVLYNISYKNMDFSNDDK